MSQINRLQQIQNCLARTVVKAPKSSHITPILRSLHWLKINECMEYKLLSLTYCFTNPILHSLSGSTQNAFTDLGLRLDLLVSAVAFWLFLVSSFYFLFLATCARLH